MRSLFGGVQLPNFKESLNDPTPIGDDLRAAAKILGVELHDAPTLSDTAKLIRALAERIA